MSGKSPRAKVRLRLDKGTLLLRQFGITSITCLILDLSEAGCQCRFTMEELDDETGSAWKQVLSPGRVLSVELTEPPELCNLIFREAQVRWVKATKSGDLDFGLLFASLDDFQKNTLNQAMMTFASDKLRAKKAAEGLTTTTTTNLKAPPPPPAQTTSQPIARKAVSSTETTSISAVARRTQNASEQAAPVLDKRTASGKNTKTGSVTRSGAWSKTSGENPITSGSRLKAQRSDARASASPPLPDDDGIKAPERQKRQSVFMAAVFEFCDSKGLQWETGTHQGRTIDFSEGGFKLEGPAPDCCDTSELVPSDAHALVTIRSSAEEVHCRCRVRSAQESPSMKGFWLYGMQIVSMSESDRKQLREMYIRAGFERLRKR